MPGSVVGAVASGVVGAGLNRVFGPKPPKASNFQIGSLTSPGVSLIRSGSDVNVTRGLGVSQPLAELRGLNVDQGAALGNLLNEVRPGFSALRRSRLQQLEGSRRRAIGNLRDNLSRRRIAGSSFANEQLAAAEAEFAQLEDRIVAETTLAELDAFNRVLTQRFNTLSRSAQTAIDQANVEAKLGANFAAGVQTNLSSIFNTSAQLAAQNASGLGSFFEPAVSSVGNFVGGLFQPSPVQTDAAGRILGGI